MSHNPGRKLLCNGWGFCAPKNAPYPYIDPRKANLAGKGVLVTGASKGLGALVAKSYARAGCSNIVITARSDLTAAVSEVEAAAVEAGKPKPNVLALKMDVTSRESVDDCAKQVRDRFGHLDIVLNNAGVLEKWVPIVDSDPDAWWNTWETNIKGTYLVTRAFMPLLEASPNADRTIVMFSSFGAHSMAPGASAYQITKLALIRMAEYLDMEGKEKGILSFSVHPASAATEMGKNMPDNFQFLLTDDPQICGDALVFLTKERRNWLAGRFISCNWDMEELMAKQQDIVDYDLLKVRMMVEYPEEWKANAKEGIQDEKLNRFKKT